MHYCGVVISRICLKKIALAIFISLLLGCGGESNQVQKTPTDLVLTSIQVTPPVLVISSLGGSSGLSATALDQNSSLLSTQPSFQWSSSATTVAMVDNFGKVTALTEGQSTITVAAQGMSQTVLVVVSTSAFNVSGKISYYDKQYGPTGFNGKREYKAVRYAVVDLLDSLDRLIQSTYTDAQGNYSLGPFIDPQSKLRVLSQTGGTGVVAIKVANHQGAVYGATQSMTITGTQTSLNLDIGDSAQAGAFNILDVMIAGAQYKLEMKNTPLATVAVYWQSGSSRLGTYFCTGQDSTYCPRGKGIYLLGGSTSNNDTDEFDDDIIFHEFSHFLEYSFDIAQSPGGAHAFADNDLDLRLSWSEGFGGYFPAAVKSWLKTISASSLSIPASLSASVYVDTVGSIASSIDIGNPGGYPYYYASNEIAVANILWQLNQHQSAGETVLWQVYEDYLPTLTNSTINLEVFWDGLLQVLNPDANIRSQLSGIFSSRLVAYYEDNYENDDASAQARLITPCSAQQLCSGETHYFYKNNGNPDVDFFYFPTTAGKSYTIETYGLKNGTDTVLKIYDSSLLLLTENDDRSANLCCLPNDDLTLSSLITFTPSQNANYFIQASSPTDRAPSAGKYGTYVIKVTEN